MDQQKFLKHRLRNFLHTAAIIGGMSLLLAFAGELIFGEGLGFWILAGAAFAIFFAPDVSGQWVLRMYRAQPINPLQAPQLYGLSNELSRRAELENPPTLFLVPHRTVNAFAVGSYRHPAIALTEGLLSMLSQREVAGVLAHEISHIAKHDLKLMGLADLMSRLTHFMSLLGMLLVFLSLPMVLLGHAFISLPAVLLLILAPVFSATLQFALSRVREFDADLEAVKLTQDPEGLANALFKIEQQQGSLWQRILMPGYKDMEPSVFRTHPDTSERIQRLLSLKARYRQPIEMLPWSNELMRHHLVAPLRRPRHRFISGVWR